MRVEAKLEELGLTLPEPPKKIPPGVQVSFAWAGLGQDPAVPRFGAELRVTRNVPSASTLGASTKDRAFPRDVNLREDEKLPRRNERSSSAMQNGGKHPYRRERML
jgi:hypothetical protein